MAQRPRYDLKEVTAYASLKFHRVNLWRVKTFEVRRGGRFFSISETIGGFRPPAISMN